MFIICDYVDANHIGSILSCANGRTKPTEKKKTKGEETMRGLAQHKSQFIMLRVTMHCYIYNQEEWKR